jgi:CspA family cold shock protein
MLSLGLGAAAAFGGAGTDQVAREPDAAAEHHHRPPGRAVSRSRQRFNAERGYGFIAPSSGGKDVFVHVSALERSGIEGLSEGQTVVVDVVEGRKGPEAARVRLI